MILKKDVFGVSEIGMKIAQQFHSTGHLELYWWMENSNPLNTVPSLPASAEAVNYLKNCIFLVYETPRLAVLIMTLGLVLRLTCYTG